jgi:ParB-like chromosome segregation protein Spo0J
MLTGFWDTGSCAVANAITRKKLTNTIKIADIKVGARFRKELGDIYTLTKSIQEIGLLHPVVINQNNELIAGARTLEACKALGWNEIHVTVVKLDDIIKCEFHENAARKDFTYSEIVEIKRAIEPEIAEQAQEREKAGIRPSSDSDKGRTDEKVADFVGVSRDTLRKAEEVVEAAEQNPEKFEIIREQMDNDEISVKKAIEIVKHQRRLERLQKITDPQTDLEILEKLGIPIRPYDVWNFQLDLKFGKSYPGNIPAAIVFNTLYFFTRQGDLVYDPISGGGVVGDVCNAFRRRCLIYDVNPHPRRNDIKQYDILSGIPEEARGAELMFWDPPYYKRLEKEYGLESILKSLAWEL